MAKSESTKYRLAEAMKTCMKTTSVDDITIRQIVEVCGVTRQTFYRNFLDKYDLINWYFDKLLLKSFEHMGEGTTVYDGLVKKFEYLKEEHLFFAHVGIYVGDGMMIHCGDPIKYASINTNYWQEHFYAFGRLN